MVVMLVMGMTPIRMRRRPTGRNTSIRTSGQLLSPESSSLLQSRKIFIVRWLGNCSNWFRLRL
jgi:hypothetical protein